MSAAVRRLCLDTRRLLLLLLLLMSAAMEYRLRQTVCRRADVTGDSAALQQQVRAVLCAVLTNRCIDHGVCAAPGRVGAGWVGLDHSARRADVMLRLTLLVGHGKRGRLPAGIVRYRD